MGCVLLTGATGLLGAHLLRNWLRDEIPLAVVVRPVKTASAAARVEQLVSRWEQQAGYDLPRPVVLEGDIARPQLGLSADSLKWVARHCTSVMHNAASLAFVGEGRDGEPYRSNVDGTRHVLELCRTTGIRHLHHVSTAYVCGAREGVCLETELDVGQSHGNEYEVSKFESEQLVHRANFLETRTIYRPGIILGDSQTGWTTSFHGFYVPLKLIATLIEHAVTSGLSQNVLRQQVRLSSQRLLGLLGFRGSEQKNFVTVDWVADAMTSIVARPEHHGRTYHLTPQTTTPISLMQSVLERAFFENAIHLRRQGAAPVETLGRAMSEFDVGTLLANFDEFFVKRMEPYSSYWRDDPQFDTANTIRAVPHLRCPKLDAACLTRMCAYALRVNFGFPKEIVHNQRFPLHEGMQPLIQARDSVAGCEVTRRVGLSVRGPLGGQWTLQLAGQRLVAADSGSASPDEMTLCLNSHTWRELSERKLTVDQALTTGALLVEEMQTEADQLVARAVVVQLVEGASQLPAPGPLPAPVPAPVAERNGHISNGAALAPIVVFDATQRRKERLRLAARSGNSGDSDFESATMAAPRAAARNGSLPHSPDLAVSPRAPAAPAVTVPQSSPLPRVDPPAQPAIPPHHSNGKVPGDLAAFLVNFVVEQTGYPTDMVELDADLEADLGIDSIKKAQLFGELAEAFEISAVGDLSLSDFPTLRHVLTFLERAPRRQQRSAT
jgi:nucleoside-diphosphate-sugar epimerase/acyl carrier protein